MVVLYIFLTIFISLCNTCRFQRALHSYLFPDWSVLSPNVYSGWPCVQATFTSDISLCLQNEKMKHSKEGFLWRAYESLFKLNCSQLVIINTWIYICMLCEKENMVKSWWNPIMGWSKVEEVMIDFMVYSYHCVCLSVLPFVFFTTFSKFSISN